MRKFKKNEKRKKEIKPAELEIGWISAIHEDLLEN